LSSPEGSGEVTTILNRWLAGAIVVALASAAGVAASSSGSGDPRLRLVADPEDGGCGAVRIAEVTVATLRNAPLVTLIANGTPVTLLLDTGSQSTVLTPAVARRIGAQVPRVEFHRELSALRGSLQSSEVELRSFTAAGVALPWRRVRVAPVKIPSIFSGPLDGVLGADILGSFDVDLDLPHHRMVLYQRQSCRRAAPAWTEPYATIATGRSLGDHLFFPVQLDHRRIYALFDTGAQVSVLSTKAALALGVTKTALARDQTTMTTDAAAQRLSAHVHRFSQLELAGEVVRSPELIVTDMDLSDADLVLGIDFLGPRRIWLSYGSQQIFLSRRS
jgi:predicted aspartyl protease